MLGLFTCFYARVNIRWHTPAPTQHSSQICPNIFSITASSHPPTLSLFSLLLKVNRISQQSKSRDLPPLHMKHNCLQPCTPPPSTHFIPNKLNQSPTRLKYTGKNPSQSLLKRHRNDKVSKSQFFTILKVTIHIPTYNLQLHAQCIPTQTQDQFPSLSTDLQAFLAILSHLSVFRSGESRRSCIFPSNEAAQPRIL